MEIVYSRDGPRRLPAPRGGRGRRDLPRPLPGERARGRRRRALRRQRGVDRRHHAARRGGRRALRRQRLRAAAALARRGDARADPRAPRATIALAIGVVGLINVQYAVHAGELYVIEANPRASRTVPFVSKAVGVPLAKLACRDHARRAHRRRWACPQERQGLGFGDHISVKEAVLPFDRFEGSDARARPRDALDRRGDGHRARLPDRVRQGPGGRRRAAAERGHGLHHRHRLRQGRRRSAIAQILHDNGFRIVATRGTAEAIARMGVPVERLNKIGEGSPHVRRLDRARRRRPRRQHAHRRRRAHRRLRDPPRRRHPRHPLPDDALRGHLGRARDLARADRRRAGGAVPAGAARDRPRRERRPASARPRAAPADARRARRAAGADVSARGRRRRARPGTRPSPAAAATAPGSRERAARPRPRRRSDAASSRSRRCASSAPTACCASPTPTRPRPRPASSRCSPPPSAGAEGRTSGRSSPRAFSVARHADGEAQFLLEDVGPGTRRLCELGAGEGLWVRGPARRGFTAPGRRAARAILVGGGVGIAPLAILQDALDGAGVETSVLLGFRDGAACAGAALLRGAQLATDDGSAATTGSSPSCSSASSSATPRRPSTPAARPDARGVRALCASAAACPPSSRWSPAWPAASAPASAASCPTAAAATCACASTGP